MLPSQIQTDPAIPRFTVRALLRDMVMLGNRYGWYAVVLLAVLAMAAMDPAPWLGQSAAVAWGHAAYRELVLASLVDGSIALVVVAFVRKQQLPPLHSLTEAFKRLLPMAVATLLALVMVVAGFLLLVVPGLIWMAALMPLLPIVMAERLGPFAAIRRSFAMTKGHRVRILAGMLVTCVIAILFAWCAAFIVIVRLGDGIDEGVVSALDGAIFWSTMELFLAAYAAVVYVRLRGLEPQWTPQSRDHEAAAGSFEHLAPVCIQAQASQNNAYIGA